MAEELRSYAWRCLRSSSHLQLSQKLALLRRFVLAFSDFGDLESQLVLQYEILCLCESNGTTDPDVRVADINDWISFAEDCLSAGFLSNATKAYEKVIAHVQSCERTNLEQDLAIDRLSKHLQHRTRKDNIGIIEPAFTYVGAGKGQSARTAEFLQWLCMSHRYVGPSKWYQLLLRFTMRKIDDSSFQIYGWHQKERESKIAEALYQK